MAPRPEMTQGCLARMVPEARSLRSTVSAVVMSYAALSSMSAASMMLRTRLLFQSMRVPLSEIILDCGGLGRGFASE